MLNSWGRLDVWVTSSGLLGPPSIDATTPADLQKCFEANSLAPFFALKYAPPAMGKLTSKGHYPRAAPKDEKYGSIVVVSSVASTYGGKLYSHSSRCSVKQGQPLRQRMQLGRWLRVCKVAGIAMGCLTCRAYRQVFRFCRTNTTKHDLSCKSCARSRRNRLHIRLSRLLGTLLYNELPRRTRCCQSRRCCVKRYERSSSKTYRNTYRTKALAFVSTASPQVKSTSVSISKTLI